MKKRLLSFVLAVLMIASLLPATALAADIVDSGTCGAEGDGSNLAWTLDSEGVLTISGSGDMHGYDPSAAPWHGRVKSAVIAEGVTSISWYAFYDCTSLTSVTIPDSVTSISWYAFYNCRSLTSVTIPNSVTSIGEYAFSDCTSLTSVTIPDSVTSIGWYAFYNCRSLTSVTIPDSVTSIGEYAFYNCRSLTSVTIPDSVTSIGDRAFYNCRSLTSVTIPNSVTSIGEYAFSDCTSLTSVTIPDSVTSIGSFAFRFCTSLTGIWVAEGNSHYSSDVSGVLFNKDKTTLVQCPGAFAAYTIPNSVTSIGEYAFYDCISLTSVTIPDSVTIIGDFAFFYCTSLTSVTIPDSVTSIGYKAFCSCESLTSVTIPDSVTFIANEAFADCKSLTSVMIPNGVTSIHDDAFSRCTSLTSVTIPDSVTSIGDGAFFYCTSLTSVTIPNSVTIIGDSAFSHCKSLTSVAIPDSVTIIGGGAFSDCDNLTDVYYTGTEIAWNKIKISDDSAALKNATIHYFSEWTREKEPTCTEPGSETSVCPEAGCGKTFTREIPALGHSWDEGKVTKPATEAEDGVKTFTCTRCGETKTETIHSYKAVVTAPTCTKKGYTTHTCACGDSYVDTYVDALGHAWDNGKVTKEPTETETGIKTFTCTRCGETRTETMPVIPHVHSYKDVVTAPTCTAKGYTTHTCACGDSYVDTYVDALGHAWDNGKVTKEPTETETGVKTFTCTRCGETKTESIPVVSVDVTQMFTDVTKNWAYPGIQYCVTHGIMGGMGDGTFAPTGTTTRAQIVQILYNLEGTPAVSGTTPFTDLTANWYKPAILWAYQNNVVAGTSPTTFDPDQPVTREQIAVILTQYMFHVLKMERTWTPADLSTFPDGAQVSSWAKEAMQDAVALGLINGTKASDGVVYLDPQGSAARQQVATILMNFCQNVKK